MNYRPFVPNMKFILTTRANRSTAFVVLLVWLFALASGVANACLMEPPEGHSNALRAALPKPIDAPAELVGHLGSVAGYHADSDTSRQSCLKVCDDGANLLNAYTQVDQIDPGPAPFVATLWSASTRVVSAPRRLVELQLPIVGPPLRVRYAGLAL